ncbi:RsmE family RNA methyltransferase [Segetibacter aerophilus]|uniref:Ribosomal RNA small subunit methyltransferase E n=1 Tax=Segetibacter aerophilus TaxID=670293 RepID=A0A512BF84_9BACT|nr:RsmE family RNA methyltransferase [Segetibacter aerophilus]GEO10629.1 ribosomal RNA small subunit methyltransferase E [Segetibacter aerophilus]
MDIPIFFLDHFSSADILTLNEDTSKHVVQVLRMKTKEQLQLTDGAGNLLTAQIIDEHKKKCTVAIIERKFIARKNQEVSVAISLLKNSSRFEWFLEKATEIGVSEIIPLLCDRTEKQHFRSERMKQIVVSAMMQSKQAWLPLLHQPQLVSEVIKGSRYNTKLVAHCEEEIKSSINSFRLQQSVQILIGPEGDFTKEEISVALAKSYIPVSLGETRLRTETAGVVAACMLCVS